MTDVDDYGRFWKKLYDIIKLLESGSPLPKENKNL